jgi:hypothetical protein
VSREGYERAEHLGAAGSEQGRDIIAWRDGEQWAFSCKRVRRFGPKGALAEVEKVLALPEDERPVGLVFLVTCDVSANTRQQVRDRCAGEMECHFWAGTEIDERVKRHTDIVVEFFGGAFAGTLHDEGLRDSGKGELASALKVQAVSPEMGYLNVRPQPSTERPPVAQVADGTVLEALEPGADARAKVGQGGQWLHVRTPTGVTGYVAAWYLRLYKEAEPPPPPSPAPPPAGVRVQVVSPEAGYLNVRPLPSTAQAPIAQVNDGAVLEPLEPEADVQAKVQFCN